MNYGKYFRVNSDESFDGVTVYDYVDLPAYAIERKSISPKYPVSVVITENAVRFRLHYCAYKYGDGKYAYDLVDNASAAPARTAHVNEVILELPFADNNMAPVSSVLSHVFSVRFPLLSSDDSQGHEENTYLAQLLNRRYREPVRDGRTFSTIWLMGLKVNEGGEEPRINLKDQKGFYVGFLRKLVLDFMFDLRHTDVFQNSSDYERMYSGLMSDFLFSALMHKCEYYYQRGLIVDAIDKADRNGNPEEEMNNIRQLYVPRFLESERRWVDDIMNPAAERVFVDTGDCVSGSNAGGIAWKRLAAVVSPVRLKSSRDDFWFANPEEELRRVCFTMRGTNEERHLCNSETVAEYVGLTDKKPVQTLRSRISKWFLKRNAFIDAFHIHFPRFADYILPALIVVLTALAVLCRDLWTKSFWSGRFYQVFNSVVCLTGVMGISSLLLVLWPARKRKPLSAAKLHLVGKRLLWWTLWVGTGFCALLCLYKYGYGLPFWLLASISLSVFLTGPLWASVRIIPNVHLTYPRLIASIAAAWFTLVIGNELVLSFFDIIPSALSCVLLSLVVFVFVLYDMNRDLPSAPSVVKFFRSLGVLCVSLCMSVLIGIFVLNFAGERFLERSGNLGGVSREMSPEERDLYETTYGQTLSMPGDAVAPAEGITNLPRLEEGRVRKVGQTKEYPVATVWTFGNGYRIFLLNGFLIQFAFLAMFIGVFIQMIFEDKSLNEL